MWNELSALLPEALWETAQMVAVASIVALIAGVPLGVLLVATGRGGITPNLPLNRVAVPLAVAAIPFFGRLVEAALREVPRNLVEAARAMGASPLQIVLHVLLPEARPGIVAGFTITVISLIGYSAIAGAIGAGGLGALGVQYGYERFDTPVMVSTVVVLIVMVQIIQWLGDRIARRLSHR